MILSTYCTVINLSSFLAYSSVYELRDNNHPTTLNMRITGQEIIRNRKCQEPNPCCNKNPYGQQ